MALPIDTRNPIGKLDFDTEDRNLPPQHYRYAKNGRSGTSDRDGDGAVENIRGNVLRNESYSNRGFVIGTAPDVKNNAVVYFIYEGGNVEITYTSAVATVGLFTFLVVVDGSEDFPVNTRLKITQGTNIFYATVDGSVPGVYSLNVTSGSIVSGDDVTEIIRLNSLSRIERYYDSSGVFENLTNPQLMGDVLNFSNTARIFNPRLIESAFGQLLTWTDGLNAIRLMNIDKMKQGGEYHSIAADEQYINLSIVPPMQTITSGWTNSSLDLNMLKDRLFQFRYRYIYDDNRISAFGDMSDVAIPTNPETDDSIFVFFNTGHHLVKKVQLAYRFGNGVSESGSESAEWYIFQTYDKAAEGWGDDTVIDILFTGNESTSVVSRIDSDRNFESIPQVAGSIEVVSPNSQIVAAKITEGYDNYIPAATVSPYNRLGMFKIMGGNNTFDIIDMLSDTRLDETVQSGWKGFIVADHGGPTTDIIFTLNGSDISSFSNLVTRISSELLSAGFPNSITPNTGYSTITFTNPGDFLDALWLYNDYGPTRGLCDGSQINIGIVYSDSQNRNGGVNVLVKDYNPVSYIEATPINRNQYIIMPQIKIDVTGPPPSWAVKYHFVVTEGSLGDYASAGLGIEIPDSYSFVEGQYIRKHGDAGLYENPYIIQRIKSYDIATKTLTLDDDSTVTKDSDFYFDLFTPNTNRSIYFENSIGYTITGGSHGAVRVFGGNAYYYIFGSSIGSGIFSHIYLQNRLPYSTEYDSDFWFKGRVQIETPNQKRQTIGTLRRWSGVLIDNTQINNLHVWDDGNYNNEINARFGDITGMRQIGYTLKTIQWANMNSSPIGRREVNNADDSTQLVLTNNLIGSTNPSEIGYGTKYAGSIVVSGRLLFFVDTIKAKVIVDDGNGENEVAQYIGKDNAPSSTMSKYFRAKCAEVNGNSDWNIITGCDELYGDFYFSFVNYFSKTQETLYFNKDQNAWKFFMDMESRNEEDEVLNIIDCYGSVGQSFFGFLQANTFQFNKLSSGGESVYSTLFKVNETDPLKPLVIETIGMLDPDKVKIFQSHWLHSNRPIELVEITVPANTMYPLGMYTVLKAPNFAYREGVYYADIKNDMYTNGIPADETARRQAIANGRKMRGHVCLVRITYRTDEYVKLYSTGVGMIPSELS